MHDVNLAPLVTLISQKYLARVEVKKCACPCALCVLFARAHVQIHAHTQHTHTHTQRELGVKVVSGTAQIAPSGLLRCLCNR